MPTNEVPTNEERREAAKRKLEQELERRAQKAKQSRILALAGALAAVIAVVAVAGGCGVTWRCGFGASLDTSNRSLPRILHHKLGCSDRASRFVKMAGPVPVVTTGFHTKITKKDDATKHMKGPGPEIRWCWRRASWINLSWCSSCEIAMPPDDGTFPWRYP